MNIIVAGAGKVGFNLAKTLCIGHNVILIDKNAEALHSIQESLDILPIKGNVEDSKTYKNLPDKEIDLFIAVTNIDNINLIAILMADAVLNIKRRFIRLQKHFYNESIIKARLNIDEIIFPTKLTSTTIASLLDYPKANNVKSFKYTKHKLVSVRVSQNISHLQKNLNEFALIGIERDKEFFIPSNNTQIKANDLIYLFGHKEYIRTICAELELEDISNIQKCVIFGGEELGVSISKELLKINREVKLIEKDLTLCKKADEELGGKASIINSKYGTYDIFENEGLENADIFIAATNNDEYNIIKCLEAKDKGIKKVVAVNNKLEYYNLMHSLGIIVVRGPKMSAYKKIMEEVSSSAVVIHKSFCGAKASVFMRKIFPNSKLINKKIESLKLEETVTFFMRNEILYLFDQKIVLQEKDLIITFCTSKKTTRVEQWIYGL